MVLESTMTTGAEGERAAKEVSGEVEGWVEGNILVRCALESDASCNRGAVAACCVDDVCKDRAVRGDERESRLIEQRCLPAARGMLATASRALFDEAMLNQAVWNKTVSVLNISDSLQTIARKADEQLRAERRRRLPALYA